MKKLILSLLLSFGVIAGIAQSLPNIWVPASGTDTYTTNITGFGTSYSNKIAHVKFANNNTSTATININGIGAAAIRKWDGDSWETLSPGDIDADIIYRLSYSTASSYFQLEPIGTGSGAAAERKDRIESGTSYTIQDSDNGYNIHFTNAAGCDVTIPAGLVDSLYFNAWRETGAGQVSFTGDGTSELRYIGSDDGATATLDTANAVVYWQKIDDDIFQGAGSMGVLSSGGGSGAWGDITGDINDQQDLLNYVAESIDSVVVADGDKGDITVSSTGTVWTIDNLAVTAAKLATLSSSDLSGKLTNETGTGVAVFSASPTFTGTPAAPTASQGTNTTQIATTAYVQTEVALKSNKLITTNRQSASYTLVLSDADTKLVEMNVGSANNLTVPANASVAFPIGTQIIVSQYGAGQTTFVEDTGVTINSRDDYFKLTGQFAIAVLLKIGTNEWYLSGDLTN